MNVDSNKTIFKLIANRVSAKKAIKKESRKPLKKTAYFLDYLYDYNFEQIISDDNQRCLISKLKKKLRVSVYVLDSKNCT